MQSWEITKEHKLAKRIELLGEYLAPADKLPKEDDVSGFIDQCVLLSEKEKRITGKSIEQLEAAYGAGELTAEEVAKAYFHRATLAHQLTNCITEVRFVDALSEAKKLDSYFKEHGKLFGPLHGVVVSLKDNINVKGLDTSIGFIGLAGKPATEDAAIVKLLKKLGALIICKTNIPCGLLYTETTNLLWGRTLNPFGRKNLNVGGSSGGEGAMAALRGSCFGIGSDIGGSVRHPAALNYAYSIKPSFGRVPCYGTASGQPGQESIRTVYGFLSAKLEDIKSALKAMVDAEPYKDIDASCLPLPYRPYELPVGKKLNIGFMPEDGLTRTCAPVLRGLDIVKEALRKQGHNVIDWPDTLFPELRQALYPFYSANGLKEIKEILKESGEPLEPHMANSVKTAKVMPVSDLWTYQTKRTELVQKYLEFWNTGYEGGRLDAVIIPTSAYPVCLLGKVPPQPYTSVWNAVDYSASTFPVTRTDVSIDKPEERTSFLSEIDKDVNETYKAELAKFDGAPVSLQVVCNKLEEEKCLELTKYISSLI